MDGWGAGEQKRSGPLNVVAGRLMDWIVPIGQAVQTQKNYPEIILTFVGDKTSSVSILRPDI